MIGREARNKDKMLGDLYAFHQTVNNIEPTVMQISFWKAMNIHRLKVEHEKMKGKYETKILSAKKS